MDRVLKTRLTVGPTPLSELALVFLRLGATSFGGPAAHIALMEDELVRRRGWLSREQFLDLLGATNLIPGPNSTEMAIHIGRLRGGGRGLVVAGACFICPAVLIVLMVAEMYVRFGTLPQVESLLYGVKPVVIAITVHALWRLARTAVRSVTLAAVAVVATVLALSGVDPVLLLALIGGALAIGKSLWRRVRGQPALLLVPMGFLRVFQDGAVASAPPFAVGTLFLFFLKVGAVLFGSGYVLIAFLRADLVERWRWLTESQLLDAIAVGQFTPGPVFTTATFIGYLLGGTTGAAAATVGIFLPAFVFVALSAPLVARFRESQSLGTFLDGVNVASLALMAVVTWQLASAALIDFVTMAIALASSILLIQYRINSAWLILAGAVVGLLLGRH